MIQPERSCSARMYMVAGTNSKKHKHRTYLCLQCNVNTHVNVVKLSASNVYLLVRISMFNVVNVTVPEVKCSPCNVLHVMFNTVHVMFYGCGGAFAEVVTERE